MKLRTIEKPRGSLEILVHLYRNDKVTVTGLIKDANLNQRTTYSALSQLINNQLISQDITDGFPVCKYYGLTKKGKDIAKHLNSIEKLLSAGK